MTRPFFFEAVLFLLTSSIVCVVPLANAFAIGITTQHTTTTTTALSASYLDSLGDGGPPPPSTPTLLKPPPSTSIPTQETQEESSLPCFANQAYFAMDQLASKGPRATADWGKPVDGTRKLADDGTFRVGAWFCTAGGWASPNPKAHTEIFYMLAGHGCLTDSDGVRHYFGPGDTVVIPKGHTGRWDVYETIHKIWAVNDHEHIEEPGPIIRVHVEHYHQSAPQYLTHQEPDPLYDIVSPVSSYARTFYNVGPTHVGWWVSQQAESFYVPSPAQQPSTSSSTTISGSSSTTTTAAGARRFFHIVEGLVVLANENTGEARQCGPGDTVMLHAGWSGHVHVLQPVKMIGTTAV